MITQTPPDIRGLIADYLGRARMMQLSTCVDNRPWCCNVWFAYDDDLSVYWFSSITRRHSREVASNPHVAAAIVLPTTPEDIPRGLQLEGSADQLTADRDAAQAKSRYIGRIFSEERVAQLVNSPTSPHAFYRVRPTQYVLFDALNFPESPRQEFRI